MKSQIIAAAALALIGGVEAHTRFVELFINGEGQGEAVSIRMDTDSSTTTAPVADITSTDMVCGVDGLAKVDRTVTTVAGDNIALLHRSWADGEEAGVIDANHKGPTSIYMKKVADVGVANPWEDYGDGSGDGWFKISWDGYVLATNTWGVDELIANGGYTTAQLPADLAGGYYLVRSEILSLQNRDNGIVPQFFVGCAQVFVEGSGAAAPETVSIPGYVNAETPSLQYDIYATPATEFPYFGPAVYKPTTAETSAIDTSSLTAVLTTAVVDGDVAGLCSDDTVLQVGNNCYTELASWTDDTAGSLPKCWAASDSCWATLTQCWDDVSPAINGNDHSKGCWLWDTKCTAVVAWCEAGNTSGPPNAGTVLTQAMDTTSVVTTRKRSAHASSHLHRRRL